MITFPPIDPDAAKVLTFDCRPQLESGEVLQGGITLKPVMQSAGAAIDPNPQNIVLGPPSYDSTGQFILLPVGNLSTLLGNDYQIEMESRTTFPINNIVARGLLQVRET